MDRGGTSGAGILDTGRRLEAKARIGLKHQRCREFLLHEATVHRTEIDLINVGRRHASIGERALRHLDDQRFDIAPVMLAEFAVCPADDAPGHSCPPASLRGGT